MTDQATTTAPARRPQQLSDQHVAEINLIVDEGNWLAIACALNNETAVALLAEVTDGRAITPGVVEAMHEAREALVAAREEIHPAHLDASDAEHFDTRAVHMAGRFDRARARLESALALVKGGAL